MVLKCKHVFLLLLGVGVAWLAGSCKTVVAPSAAEAEQKIFQLINRYRASVGLNTLEWSDVIAVQCRQHSRNMALGTTAFGHQGFEERMANIRAAISFSTAAENVAYTTDRSHPAQVVYDEWLGSQEHAVHIQGNFNLTGVGVSKSGDGSYYFTQIFIRAN